MLRTAKRPWPSLGQHHAWATTALALWLIVVPPAFAETPYRFEIIVETGAPILDPDGNPLTNPIAALGSGPSINDQGKIAFAAQNDAGVQGLIVLNDGVIERNTAIPPTENIGVAVQINNSDQVIAWKIIDSPGSQVHGDTAIIRFDLPVTEADPIIGLGSNFFTTTPFNYVASPASLNNDGLGVFTGDLKTGGTVLASRNGGTGAHQMTPPLANFPTFFPMAADNDRVVIRGGDSVTDSIIVFTEPTLNPALANGVATSSEFSALGGRPGISDDGRVVAFIGNSNADGPGLFIVILDNLASPIRHKVTDIGGIDPASAFRVAVNRTGGASSMHEYTVAYLANSMGGMPALHTIRIDLANPALPSISPSEVLVAIGDHIPGIQSFGPVGELGWNDAINNSCQVVFWARAASGGQQAIIRAMPSWCVERIFLDWINPVSAVFEKKIMPSGSEYYPANRKDDSPRIALPATTYRQTVLQHLRDIFDQSGIDMNVDEYMGEKRHGDALYVRFAPPLPPLRKVLSCGEEIPYEDTDVTIPGMAYDGHDRFNSVRGGEVAMFIDPEGAHLNMEKEVAQIIAHETGHAFGARHINPSILAIEVMDYESPGAGSVEEFTSQKADILEPPLRSLIEDRPECVGSDPEGFNDHNPKYHIQRYALRQVPSVIDPGDWDVGQYDVLELSFENINLPPEIQMFDLAILGEESAAFGLGEESTSFAFVKSPAILDPTAIKAVIPAGAPVRIYASSTTGPEWDLIFTTGEVADAAIAPSSLVAGTLNGIVVQFDLLNGTFTNIGTFSTGIKKIKVVTDDDADSDGIPNPQDNCPNTPNGPLSPDPEGGTDQQDDDLDGIGNACDLRVATTSLPSGRAGKIYSKQLLADRGTPPYTWTLTSGAPPIFVTLGSDGLLYGDVQSTFLTFFTVQVMDATGDIATQDLSIRVTIPNCVNCHAESTNLH